MARYEVSFTVPLELVVTVEVGDDIEDYERQDIALDQAWKLGERYLDTVQGDHQNVRAMGTLDGIGGEILP